MKNMILKGRLSNNLRCLFVSTLIVIIIAGCGGGGGSRDIADPVPVTGITLDKANLSIYVDDNEPLTAAITPTDATNQNMTWTSSNERVATVSESGVVEALTSGNTTISVTTEDGGIIATCYISILDSCVTCTPVNGGGSAQVQEPRLIATLFNSARESWLGSPAVADLDGDGTMEILVPRDDLMLGWHLDGEIVFSAQTAGRIWAPPVVADIDPDTVGLEVAVVSNDSIFVWDKDGNSLPGFPFVWIGELKSIAAGDINGDGLIELVVAADSPIIENDLRDIIIAVDKNGSILPGFSPNISGASGCDDDNRCYITGGFDQSLALGDVDSDGNYDVLTCQDNAYMNLYDGTGRAFDAADIFPSIKFSGIRFFHDYALAQQGWANDEETANQAHFTNSAPAIADIDNDGDTEIIVLASVQNAAQSDRLRGVALWVLNPDGTRPGQWEEPFHTSDYLAGLWDFDGTNIVAATNQVSVADIAPEAGLEMVFAGFDGRIHLVSAGKEQLWEYTYTTDTRVLTGGVLVADLSGDGIPEIVFATYSPDADKSHLFILGADGQLLHTTTLPDRGAMAVPTIADVDGNGTLEIVVSLKDAIDDQRQVCVYSVDSSSTNCLLWPTGRGNLSRNAYIQ